MYSLTNCRRRLFAVACGAKYARYRVHFGFCVHDANWKKTRKTTEELDRIVQVLPVFVAS